MRITPYSTVGQLKFGATETEAVGLLGLPVRRGVNRRGGIELHYPDSVYRFGQSSGFLECSGQWSYIDVEGLAIATKTLPSVIRETDSTAVEYVGFLVSGLYGISADLEHIGWVSIFARGRWDHILKASNKALNADARNSRAS